MGRKAFSSGIIFEMTNILLLSFVFIMGKKSDLNIFYSFYAVMQGTIGVILLKKYYPLYSLAPLFLILSEIFHFGQSYILAIGREDLLDYTNINLAGNIQNYNAANIFAFMVQGSVVFGALIVSKKRNRIRFSFTTAISQTFGSADQYAVQISTLATAIGFVPTVMYYGRMISSTFKGISYAGIREASDIGVLSFFQSLYTPGIFALVISLAKRGKKEEAKIACFCACLFEGICMLSGNRGVQITKIMVFVFIYFYYIEKFKLRNFLMLGFGAYILIVFLYFISAIRLSGMTRFNLSEFLKILGGEPVIRQLAQQGSTLNMVVLTVRDVPSYTPYSCGIQYLASLINVFPGTSHWAGNLPYLANTLRYLNTSLPLGDSYIAELYHNFGWVGVIFSIFIGAFLGRITNAISSAVSKCKCLESACYCVLFRSLLWMVRSNFFNFLFEYVWGCLMLYAVSLFVLSLKRMRTSIRV